MNMATLAQGLLRRRSKEDLIFDIANVVMLTGAFVLVLYPLYFIVIASISNPDKIYAGEVTLLPQGITFDGYQRIFKSDMIWRGYANSILYAGLSTLISVTLILTSAYALSRKDLAGRNIFMAFFIFTMFFGGGLIPTYLVVKQLGMLNTIWAMVLPGAVGVWNIIIARTFFQLTIPDQLREAAFIDGASNFRFFMQFVLPLSKPLIAVMVLIHIVGNWNSFFDALIYLTDEKMYPLQLVLRNILIQSDVATTQSMITDIQSYAAQQRVAELLKYGVIIVSTAPLLIIYPFLQKYFVHGTLIGAIKE
jgi:putative aldouronate transport system permease protein